jgi:hypothetical protein
VSILPATDEAIAWVDATLGLPVLTATIATLVGPDRARACLFVIDGLAREMFGPDPTPDWRATAERFGPELWAGARFELAALRDRVAAELASVTGESTSSHNN